MRILADKKVPLDLIKALRENGFDVTSIHSEMPGISDVEVLRYAESDNRVLLTFDKDFGDLAVRRDLPATCGIILVRTVLGSPDTLTSALLRLIESRDDWAGHFSVIEEDRIRMRRL